MQDQELAGRVYAVFSDESAGGNSPLDWLMKEPSHIKGYLTEFELDLRDWGLAFGLAYALARSEDPFGSAESVGQRALDAARTALGHYASGWHPRGKVTPPDDVVTPIGARS